MTADYQILHDLAHIYLEDSFVLGIFQKADSLTFELEAVLTEKHPLYKPPKAGEQYCYLPGLLVFGNARQIIWSSRSGNVSVDANNEEDLGNIDFLIVDSDNYHLGGDWGEVRVYTASEPVLIPEREG